MSFFSDNIAQDAPKHGFATVFVSLLLSFLFFFCGFFAADTVPFSTHYDNATGYMEFIGSAFDDGFSISDMRASSDKTINTYTNDADKTKYVKNGYDLIVDTRPSETLIEFTQSAVKGDTKIDYEQYLQLSPEQRKDYKLLNEFTGNELEFTTELEVLTTEYLEKISVEGSEEYNKEGAKAYSDLKAAKDGYTRENYRKELWYLYVKYYYTFVRSVMAKAKAPTLRDYYYLNYVADGKAHYFYLFEDMCAGSFETDTGVPVVFGGYFTKCNDGEITDVSGFIKQVYYDTVGRTFFSYLISAVSQIPMLVLIPMILALLVWGIGKAVKSMRYKSFAGCYKTINAFGWFSALAVALITFVCGFFTSARVVYKFMSLMFAAILIIRTAVFGITTAVRDKKSRSENAQNQNIKNIFGGI